MYSNYFKERRDMPKNYILQLCAINLSTLEEKQKISPIGEAKGIDGRVFNIDGVEVLALMQKNGLKIVLNVAHEYGGKAAGWFYDFELRDDGIYATLKLTQLGKELLEAEEYKYLSPEYLLNYDTNKVELIVGVGLVNQPNLLTEALNTIDTESHDMPTPKDDTDLAQQVDSLTAQNTALANQNKELLKQVSTNKVDNAIAGGKLAPAKRGFALAIDNNSLDTYLELEAQTFKKTENNSLKPESDESDEDEACSIAQQFNT